MPHAARKSLVGLMAAFLVVAAALALATTSRSAAVRKSGPTVAARINVMDNYFEPRSATVRRGQAVKWTWKGDNRHNLVFTKVPSGATKKNARARSDGSVVRTLSVAGTYHYADTLYDGMEGTVTVTDR